MCLTAHCPHCLRGHHMSDCPLPSLPEGPKCVQLPTALTVWGAFTRLTAHCPHCLRAFTHLTAHCPHCMRGLHTTCLTAHCPHCLRGLNVSSCPLPLTVWGAFTRLTAHCPHCLRGLHTSDCPLPSLSEGPSHVWLPTALTAWGAFIPHVWLPTALTAWGA